MRLKSSEAVEIANLMEKYQQGENYILVKKKGWVFVDLNSKLFGFHRKTSEKLIHGKFLNEDKYYVNSDGTKREVVDFSVVLAKLEQWIQRQL